MKQIIFRVDSSSQMGSGHLMRCLTLAKKLQSDAEITFLSRNLAGNLNYLIEQNGYCLCELPCMKAIESLVGYEKWLTVKQYVDAEQVTEVLKGIGRIDCIVIDNYAINETWEKMISPYVENIMVIDDLANRRHVCNILLDQNYYQNSQNRYKDLVPEFCRLLLGPQYALLRDEFYEAKKSLRQRDGSIRNILVFFGGSDLTNETLKALRAIKMLNRPDIAVNVVVGSGNPHKAAVETFCEHSPQLSFHCQIDYMAQLMNEADLAIGGGGSTTWERCYLGLPAIVIAIAENQVKVCEESNMVGGIIYLGMSSTVDAEQIKICIKDCLADTQRLNKIVQNGKDMVGSSKTDIWWETLI